MSAKKQTAKRRPPERPQTSRSKEELRRERRAQQAKKRKRRNRVRKLILVLVLVVAALIVIAAFFFKIDTIKVSGVSQYTDAQIVAASGVSKGDNIFLVRGSAVQERINAALPYSGKVKISRKLPHTLILEVHDAEITTAVQEGSAYYLLDGDGIVLERARDREDMIQYLTEKNSKAPIEREKKTTTTTGSRASGASASSMTTTTTTTTVSSASSSDAEGTGLTDEETEVLNHVMILSGLKIKSAVVGEKIEFKDDAAWELYRQIMDTMKQAGLVGITELDLSSEVAIKMMYQNRIYISVGDTEQLERKFEICKTVIERQDEISKQQTGELDISIPGKAFFYPGKIRKKTAGQKAATTVSSTVTTLPATAGVTSTTAPGTQAVPRSTARTTVTGVNTQRMTSQSW